MLKTAYDLGFRKAVEDAGLEKEAFFGRAALSLARKGGLLGRAGRFAVKNPLAAKTITGAGLGGAVGAVGGDEGGFMRGALTGAALGAGAGLGARYGGRAAFAGRKGKAMAETSKYLGSLGRAPSQRLTQSMARQYGRGRVVGTGLGALGAGSLAYGLSGGFVPGRQ